jgi:hypothetical protein
MARWSKAELQALEESAVRTPAEVQRQNQALWRQIQTEVAEQHHKEVASALATLDVTVPPPRPLSDRTRATLRALVADRDIPESIRRRAQRLLDQPNYRPLESPSDTADPLADPLPGDVALRNNPRLNAAFRQARLSGWGMSRVCRNDG